MNIKKIVTPFCIPNDTLNKFSILFNNFDISVEQLALAIKFNFYLSKIKQTVLHLKNDFLSGT